MDITNLLGFYYILGAVLSAHLVQQCLREENSVRVYFTDGEIGLDYVTC